MLSITTDTLDMYYSAPTLGHIILLPPVGQRIPAVNFVMWATKKDRKESKNEIEDVMMFGPDRENLKKIFHRKEYVPGELESDYVLTYDQCSEVLDILCRGDQRAARAAPTKAACPCVGRREKKRCCGT